MDKGMCRSVPVRKRWVQASAMASAMRWAWPVGRGDAGMVVSLRVGGVVQALVWAWA